MARPLKQGFDYFPHDTDASMDEKIEALEALYGLDGYAFYFKILERIYHSGTGYLDFSDEMTARILAKKFNIRLSYFKKMLESCVKIGLFSNEEWSKAHRTSSEAISKRINRLFSDRERMREKRTQDKGFPHEQTTNKQAVVPEQTCDLFGIKESKGKKRIKVNNRTIEIPLNKINGNSHLTENGELLICHQSLEKCIRIATGQLESTNSVKATIIGELERLGIDWGKLQK